MIKVLVGILLWVGALGSFLPGFPGSWIMAGTLLAAGILTGFDALPLAWTVAGIALALGSEAMEYVIGAAGARRYGARKPGIIGAILGSFIGIIVMGPIGVVIGAIVGSFALETLYRRPPKEALRAGVGATLGVIGGAIAKGLFLVTLALALTIGLII